MSHNDKAKHFAALHVRGNPLVLYNIWDSSSARSAVEAGASAIATSSWSVAKAHGYEDGQQLPLDTSLWITQRVVDAVDVPVSIDFEGGYATTPHELRENTTRLLETGAIGLNFEDQQIGEQGLRPVSAQAALIETIRQTSDAFGVDMFINARTDVFLKEPDATEHPRLMKEAVERAHAYQRAGANGFFTPGLTDTSLIETLCREVNLPVNVMICDQLPDLSKLCGLPVSRVSYGPVSYVAAQCDLLERCHHVFERRSDLP